jgi:hypothetical protein
MKLGVQGKLWVNLKEMGRIGIKLKITNPKLKNPNL